jgi:hypothetical protein
MRLSQGHLTLLATCPRKFQSLYLDQLAAPTPLESQTTMVAGQRFHRLMQHWEMGLPIDPLLHQHPQLGQWFASFQGATEQIFGPEQQFWLERQSEHQRSVPIAGHVLTVIYDLLLLGPTEARILDWKTYPKPLNPRWLAQHWQTRLYLFTLVETLHYQPEQVSMTYWFFQGGDRAQSSEPALPQSLQFSYSQAQHDQTRTELTERLTQLTNWLTRYETAGESFPQVPVTSPLCQRCQFAVRCQRHAIREIPIDPTALLPIAAIQEIPL